MSFQPLPPLGQAAMTASLPVVIASNQSTLPVSLASVPSHAVTNAGTFAVQIDGNALTALQLIDDAVFAEDTGHTTGDKGFFILAVRDDGRTTFANSNNDYTPVAVDFSGRVRTVIDDAAGNSRGANVNASNELLVALSAVPSHAVTNAGTFAVQVDGAALTALQLIDDIVFTDDGGGFSPATSKVAAVGFLFDDVAPDSVNEGDIGIGRMSANRNQYVTIRDAAGNERGLNVAADGSIAVTIASVPSHAVTNAGTFAVQVDGNALTALQLIDDTIFADDAAVTLGTSKGSVFAGVAVNIDGTDPTAVSAEGDAAAVRTDMNRILLVNETHPRFWHTSVDYSSAQTNASIKAAPGANLSLYVTDISISNGATAGNITLLDGSGGTVLYELYPGINGGAVLSLRNPIKLTANTALCITSSTVTTHSVFASGYIAP